MRFNNFYKSIFILLLLKLIIIIFLPLTGDEAYFIKWANHLSLGYYDHPPMVGWLIYLMRFFNQSYIFYRLFSFFTTLIVAFLIYKILLYFKKDENISKLVALIFLASPIDILLSLFTNDIPLLLFGSLGVYFVLLSLNKNRWFLKAIFAGVFLGSAFLSKYFALFLMLGLLIYLLSVYKSKVIKQILIISFIIALFVAQNLYYNYNSCWNNILFNFFARTEGSSYHISTILKYFLFILYIITPWGVYFLFKSRFEKNNLLKFLSSILGVVFVVFFIVSLKKKVGLHWFLLFTPYIYMLFSFVNIQKLKKLFKYNYIFSLFHVLIILAILFIPKELFKNHKKYSEIIFFSDTKRVCSMLLPYFEKKEKFFASGYTTASILSYYCKKDISMIFNNSKYGRLDDKLVDVRKLDKKNFYYFSRKDIKRRDFKGVCKDIQIKKVNKNLDYHIAKCIGFDYQKYKENFLDIQKEKFYHIPSWLPKAECYFLDRYYR